MPPLEALKSLKTLIEESSGGYRYADEWSDIRRYLALVRSGVIRQREKLSELEHWLDVYFSEQKHRQHTGGLPQIKIWILTEIDTLEGCID